ncbi:MAG: hypothetical protein S4CHLAM6_05780 [Chlamydiae bacterium]|nr:hypothetical protein [Chlamydiota bacterium]
MNNFKSLKLKISAVLLFTCLFCSYLAAAKENNPKSLSERKEAVERTRKVLNTPVDESNVFDVEFNKVFKEKGLDVQLGKILDHETFYVQIDEIYEKLKIMKSLLSETSKLFIRVDSKVK